MNSPTYFKNYYRRNKKRLLAYKAQWRDKNREHCRKYSSQYHKDHWIQDILKGSIQREKVRREEPWKNHRRYAKARCYCKKNNNYPVYGGRGIECLLTIEEVKNLWFRDKAFTLKRPSLDRKKSKKNYCYSNCRFIELSENSRLGNINRYKRRK